GEPPANLPTYAGTTPAERQMLNVMAQVDFKNKQHTFGLRRKDRRRHLYVVGKTGVGKSTLLANMIINDLKHDEGLAVIDPHGDLVETVLNYIPRRRLKDRKSTRLNSSHVKISYAVFCLKKKRQTSRE